MSYLWWRHRTKSKWQNKLPTYRLKNRGNRRQPWLKKVLNFLHLVTNLKKEVHVNTRKIKIKTKKDSKNKQDTRVKEKVDNNHIISYIFRMKGIL